MYVTSIGSPSEFFESLRCVKRARLKSSQNHTISFTSLPKVTPLDFGLPFSEISNPQSSIKIAYKSPCNPFLTLESQDNCKFVIHVERRSRM